MRSAAAIDCGELARRVTDVVGDGALIASIDGTLVMGRAADHRDPQRLASLAALIGTVWPANRGWLGHVVASARPVRIDVAPYRRIVGVDAAFASLLGEVSSALLAPIVRDGAVVGIVAALRERGGARYSLRDQTLLEQIVGGMPQLGRGRGGDGSPPDAAELAVHLRDRSAAAVWATDLAGRTLMVTPAMAELLGCPGDGLVGLPMADFVDPPPATLAGAVPDEPERGDRRLARVDGTRLWVTTVTTPLLDATGRRRGTLTTMTDVTERKETEIELRLRLDAAQGLTRILSGVLRGHDPAELLQWAVDAASDVLGIARAGVFERRPDGALLLRAGCGWPDGFVGRHRAAMLGSPAGLALTGAEPVVVADAERLGGAALERGIRSGCWVRIGDGRGVFAALHDGPREFDRGDREFLASLADAVSGCLGAIDADAPIAHHGVR